MFFYFYYSKFQFLQIYSKSIEKQKNDKKKKFGHGADYVSEEKNKLTNR